MACKVRINLFFLTYQNMANIPGQLRTSTAFNQNLKKAMYVCRDADQKIEKD